MRLLYHKGMKIIIYTKTNCGWATEVLRYLDSQRIAYEERDVLKDPEFLKEVEDKTGQNMSPTLDIDGHFIPDAGVEDVEAYLREIGAIS